MYIVKLTYNYDWPLFRQTLNSSGVWGNYKFVIDDNLKECDFWIVYSDYMLKDDTIICNPENIIFIPAECYNTSPRFLQEFLDQFGMIVTVQRELKHKNIKYIHNANPWFVGKTYDEIIAMPTPVKSKLISIVSSNKTFTQGHQNRLDFVHKLKEHFGDRLDVFGRGIKDFNDKWDVLADYKFSIAIENDFCDDWVTEKFFDCIFAHTYPIYYGCPNLGKYVDDTLFTRIDINKPDEAIALIEKLINDTEVLQLFQEKLISDKANILNTQTFFPLVVNIMNTMNASAKKKTVYFKPNHIQEKNNKLSFLKKVALKLKIIK
jgi:hypothetical protein